MSRLNLLAPEVRENPYPFYAELRQKSPLCQVEPGGIWVVTRYEDVLSAFKNTQVFSSTGMRVVTQPPYLQCANPMADSLIVADPPRHTQLRNLASRVFPASTVSSMEMHMRSMAARLTSELLERRAVDFVQDFATRAQTSVLAQLIDPDSSIAHCLSSWSADLVSIVTIPPDDYVRLDKVGRTIDEMERHMQAVLASGRSSIAHNLLSELLEPRANEAALTERDAIAFLFLLLVAGMETTVTLLTQTALVLARRPEWMDRLRAEPALIPCFVEEVLRFEPSVHATLRLTLCEVELAGVRLPAQALVALLIGSALRDEKKFQNPDRFEPERRVQANLAFGHGPHFCLGAVLARMQARLVIEEIVKRCRRFELRAERLEWSAHLNTRCPVALPIEVTPI